MPTRPPRPCSHPGCGKLVTAGRCEEHQVIADSRKKATVQRYDQARGSAAERGYDARWAAYSRQYRRDNPLCVRCLADGLLVSVERGGHVDHIKPVTGPDDPLFWEPSNHQSLCPTCHSEKTAAEDGGFGNTKR